MSAEPRAPLLEVQGISLSFGGLACLSKLDLVVGEGEIVSVIGPNGAGKTSLFNVITGVYPAEGGEILLEGESLSARIDRLPPEARRQLERNLAEIRRASAEINAALELSPGDPLLEELLLNAYQDELAVLASVNQLAGGNGAGTIDATRMKL